MRRVVVTGAGGLLGRHLLPLLAERCDVHASGARAAPNVTPLALDLTGPLDLAGLPERYDVLIHLAQSRRFREFPEGADDMFRVNVAAPLALIDHAREAGARHFIHASTGGVYAPATDPLAEDAALAVDPPFYPATKLAIELLARGYARSLTVVALRYFFIYGPGQREDMLVPRLIGNVRSKRPVAIRADGGLRINPVHAADAARATAAAMDLSDSAAINVAGPDVLSVRDICELVGRRLGIAPVYEVQPGDGGALIGDTARMRRELVAPRIAFAEGIADLLA